MIKKINAAQIFNLFKSVAMILLFGYTLQSNAMTELARVNGSVITLEDFNQKYKENLQFSPMPLAEKEFLDGLIKRELGIQAAKSEGIDQDPEVRERIHTLLFQSLLEKKLSKEVESIQISDEEAFAYFKKNPEIRTSHIFVAAPPLASATKQKEAQNRIKKIYDEQLSDGSKSFAEVAQRFSEGPTASMGGDIGYQTKDKLDPTYYSAAVKLAVGKISGIVKTRIGYYIIKLTAKPSWNDADQAGAKRAALEERKNQIFEKFVAGLKGQAKVSIHTELLKN